MAPPSLQPTFINYLAEAGNASALQAPKSLWLTQLPQVNGTNTSAGSRSGSAATGASPNSAAATSQDGTQAPAGPGSPKSSSQGPQIFKFSVGVAGVNLLSITYVVASVLAVLG